MRHSKLILILASILLCVCLAASALASESVLSDLWESGTNLLFHTDNVTVDGAATFSLDGEWFKTAELHYVQDGFRSLYQLDLESPDPYETVVNSGWTIVADEDGYIYVMEVQNPGYYIEGFDDACNDSLLRRSVELDAITEVGGLLIGQVESLLPEGALTVQDSVTRLTLTQDQIPSVVVSACNLGFTYLCDRWFSYGHDRGINEEENVPFEQYDTPTKALANGTKYWALRGVDVEIATDDQGRLTHVQGSFQVASTFRDGQVREVSVEFNLAMTDYGASRVDRFDPDDYGVTAYWDQYVDGPWDAPSLTDEEWDALMKKAVALLNEQGFVVPQDCDWMGWADWDGYFYVQLNPLDGEEYVLGFAESGNLWFFQRTSAPWLYLEEYDVEGIEEDTLAAGAALAESFLKEYNPEHAETLEGPAAETMIKDEDGSVYLAYYDAGADALFVVRVEPSLRIEYLSAGGNG